MNGWVWSASIVSVCQIITKEATMRSSTTFQMLLHLGAYLAVAFAVIEIAIILYKIIGMK